MNTLHTIFDWLIAASLRASVLTLLVLALQWLLQRHLSPRWRYALWLPVLVVLIAPVLPESRWSIESVFQSEPQPVEVHTAPLMIADIAPVSMPSTAPPVVSVPAPVDWNQVQFLTWALGASLLLLIGGASFLRTLLRFRQSRESVSDDLLSQLEAISREVGLRHSPQVLVAPAIQSPAVTGLLRATLLLPAGFERDFTAEEARLILQHELTHLKRHDLPLNTLLCVLMALHWFNPLLWLAFFKARADREAACDAQVLVNATPQRRSEYGHALLKVEAAFAPLRLSLGFVGMLQRGATLRARIRSIAQPSRTRPLTGLLVTLCITCMTFLGVTRAEKPATATNDDTTLIALEVKTVRFQQDTTWDFGGRFKQIDPTDASKAGGQIEMLSEQGFRELQDQLQKLAGVEMGAYPRMVTQDGKEVVIRSVVNQPVPGGKDSNGKDLIAALPIGFVGKFTPKAMQDGKVALNIEITDSNLLTHNAQPVAASRVYSTPLELEPGITVAQYAWQGHGWKDGKPKSYRPTITFITAHVLDPQKGGLPADASKDFAIGHSSFLPGDSIRITQVQRTDGFMTITAEYELASADAASISLYITSTKDNGRTKTDPNQRKAITKGKGRVILHLPDVREGMPHVSFYPSGGGKSFGGIYFGTQAEADASRRMSASRAAPAVSTASGATKSPDTGSAITLNFPDDPVETVIAVYAKLKGQKVSVEPAAKGNRVKIFAPKPLSPEDAIAFIEASFLLNGFVFVADGPDNLTIRKTDTPQPSVIETKLRNIILPRVQFSGASIEEAIEYLRVKSREFDTLDKTGVQIILRPGGTKPGRISLDLTNVPLIEALRYTVELANLQMTVQSYAVTISPITTPDSKESLAAKSKDTHFKLDHIVLPNVGFTAARIQDVLDYLQTQSRELDTFASESVNRGVHFILRAGDKHLPPITLNLKKYPLGGALGLVTDQAGLKYRVEGETIIIVPVVHTGLVGYANKIILPSVELRDAALVEAIEFIRAKSREHDPDKKGVNILLKGDGGTVKITLSLKDVPVPEALHYCAELSNYKLSADENSFVLTPAPPKTGANTSQLKPSDNGMSGANTEVQEKAAELRRAKPQQYDFAKAVLGDVIRFLATDAGIRFFSLPEDHPTSQRLITFSLRSSPFEVLETICRANGVVLVLDQNVWYARTADDAALVRKSYALPKTPASAETILSDIRTLLNVPATNTGTSTQGAKKAGPEVTFKEAENSVHVVATRLQHMWVDGYFKGLGGNR